jgi:hypothetical protein
MRGVFRTTEIARFEEPEYAQGAQLWARETFVERVVGPVPRLATICAQRDRGP